MRSFIVLLGLVLLKHYDVEIPSLLAIGFALSFLLALLADFVYLGKIDPDNKG